MDSNTIHILTEEYRQLELSENKIVEIDLGCGEGSFSIQLAEKYPNRIILAVDVLGGRLKKLLKKSINLNLTNIYTLKVEAWELFSIYLPDNKIDRIHLLCPDPWPKERHKRHRLISSEFISRIYRKLKRNGTFHFSTDDENYYNYLCKVITQSGVFEEDHFLVADIMDIKTDFEKKWNKNGLKVKHIAWEAK